MPDRIQLRRTPGWRKPPGAIVVARPSRWGNPFKVGDGPISYHGYEHGSVGRYGGEGGGFSDLDIPGGVLDARLAVALYRGILLDIINYPLDDEDREVVEALQTLRGHDLACWCDLEAPCHADVLLELANARRRRS